MINTCMLFCITTQIYWSFFLNIKVNYFRIMLSVLSHAISYFIKKMEYMLIKYFPQIHQIFQFSTPDKLKKILFTFYLFNFKLKKIILSYYQKFLVFYNLISSNRIHWVGILLFLLIQTIIYVVQEKFFFELQWN